MVLAQKSFSLLALRKKEVLMAMALSQGLRRTVFFLIMQVVLYVFCERRSLNKRIGIEESLAADKIIPKSIFGPNNVV